MLATAYRARRRELARATKAAPPRAPGPEMAWGSALSLGPVWAVALVPTPEEPKQPAGWRYVNRHRL
jgi:hypothetical protein